MIYFWRLVAMTRGVHLEEIAQKVGRDVPYLSRASRGLINPPNELKFKIAEYLKMPVRRAWRKINA